MVVTDLSSDKILLLRDGHVAEIVFNNPARHNAMSLSMWQGLSDHLAALSVDDTVRVVVLSGAGGKAFVSGADISEFEEQRSNADAVAHYNRVSEDAETAVANYPKPVIAKIDGYCLGGGVGLAIGCDIRLCSDGSRFAIPAGKLGLGYSYDGVAKLIDTIGASSAAELFLTGRMFQAEEALQMGLVNRIVPKEDLIQAASDLAGTIADNAPLTMRAFKAAKIEHGKDPRQRNRDRVDALVDACFASEDYAEGRAAFAERREPVFRGG
ncbi:MAG: enoyl-CoA hydratase [Pseudomonadota bacterium]